MVAAFHKLGYTDKVAAIRAAYNAPADKNLALMKEATGCSELHSDLNYIWTSAGRMALMLEESIGKRNSKPHDMATYDELLRAWVIDLEHMYDDLMKRLHEESASVDAEVKKEIEKMMELFDKKNTCENGDWANGIMLQPTAKFFLVSEWLKMTFPDVVSMANKLYFYKKPASGPPPFLRIKVHRTCFFFKGTGGPGTILVNPELAKSDSNELREDLDDQVFDSQQFTVELIDSGKSGKLTLLDDQLYVLPMAPLEVNKFDPMAPDFETDAQNSYLAFKKSHPDTIHEVEPLRPSHTEAPKKPTKEEKDLMDYHEYEKKQKAKKKFRQKKIKYQFLFKSGAFLVMLVFVLIMKQVQKFFGKDEVASPQEKVNANLNMQQELPLGGHEIADKPEL